jgi:hypothetical protein
MSRQGMVTGYHPNSKSPYHHRDFYFFNHPKTTQKGFQYLAPSPTFTANLEPLFPPK